MHLTLFTKTVLACLCITSLASKASADESSSHPDCPTDSNTVHQRKLSQNKQLVADCQTAQLPLLRLSDGYSVKNSLGSEDWLTLTVSALSQNNGTTSGLRANQFTSSNLFNLGLQIGPFIKGISTESPASEDDAPRPGQQKDKSGKIHHRIALNALFTQRTGQILSSEIPNALNTQWNFGNGPITRLNILNLEYRNPAGLVSSVKVGKLMQAQDFTVNPIQCFYSNFGMCGWAQGTPSMVQIPGNPFNSYGAVIKIGQENKTRLKYGAYQLAPDTFAPEYHGLNFRLDEAIGTAHFLELNIPLNSPSQLLVQSRLVDEAKRPSRADQPNARYETPLPPSSITIGGWMANGKFSHVKQSDAGTEFGKQNNAVYGIGSLRLPMSWLGMDNRLFVSSSIGLTPDVQNYRSGGNAGIVMAGLLPRRPFDTLSLGLAYAAFNSSYYIAGTKPGSYTPSSEFAIETNYNIALNRSVSIMPNFQYIIRPAGNEKRSGVGVAGIQIWLRF
jgi:carbohydrate-selective porin OprB